MGECPLVKKNFGERYHSQHKDMQYLCTCEWNEDKADFVGGGVLISALAVAARAAGAVSAGRQEVRGQDTVDTLARIDALVDTHQESLKDATATSPVTTDAMSDAAITGTCASSSAAQLDDVIRRAKQAAADALVPDSDAWYEARITYDKSIDKPGPSAPDAATRRHEQELRQFYARFAPHKAANVPRLVKEHGNNPRTWARLMKQLRKKYMGTRVAIVRKRLAILDDLQKVPAPTMWQKWGFASAVQPYDTSAMAGNLTDIAAEKYQSTVVEVVSKLRGRFPTIATVVQQQSAQLLALPTLANNREFLTALGEGRKRNATTVIAHVIETILQESGDVDIDTRQNALELYGAIKVNPYLLEPYTLKTNPTEFLKAKQVAVLNKEHGIDTLSIKKLKDATVILLAYDVGEILPSVTKQAEKNAAIINAKGAQELLMDKLYEYAGDYMKRIEFSEPVARETLQDSLRTVVERAIEVAVGIDSELPEMLREIKWDFEASVVKMKNNNYGVESGLEGDAGTAKGIKFMVQMVCGTLVAVAALYGYTSRSGGASGGTSDQALRMIEKSEKRNRQFVRERAERNVAMVQTKIDDLIVKAGEDVMGNAAQKMFFVRREDFYRQINKSSLNKNGNTYSKRKPLRLTTKERQYTYLEKNGYQNVIGHIRDDEKAVEVF